MLTTRRGTNSSDEASAFLLLQQPMAGPSTPSLFFKPARPEKKDQKGAPGANQTALACFCVFHYSAITSGFFFFFLAFFSFFTTSTPI